MGIVKHPFKENGVFSALSQIEKTQKLLRCALGPTTTFQNQLTYISNHTSVVEQIVNDQQRMANLFKNLDPLKNYRNILASQNSQFVRNSAWDSALAIQKSLALSPAVHDALKGITLSSELVSNLAGLKTTSRLDGILSSLKKDMIYVGEYELLEKDNDSEEESQIILPTRIEEKLELVNYTPITLFQKILNDPLLVREISPRDFEYFVAEIINKLGFSDVNVTPRSNDGGRDIIATRTINDIKMLFAFECKQYSPERKIQLHTMRSLLGTISYSETKVNMGVLVTTSFFTKGSKNLIMSEALIDGKDFDDLVLWINQVKKCVSID